MCLQKYLVGLLLLLATGASNARQVVIAFENTLQPSSSLDAMARSQMLVRNMANAGVPQAMFLVKTRGLKAKDKERLKLYSNAGHLLVNAGFNQSLETKADLYVFEIGIIKANRLLRNYAGYKKHIHFSYLHEHGDTSLQQGLKDFLRKRGYKPSYISANPMRGVDAYFDQLYQTKISSNRKVDIVALEQAYVEFVADSLNREDARAFTLLGYSPPQVLVLQENDLAAYFIAALVEQLQRQRWTIIAAERAFSDPLVNPQLHNGFGSNGYINSITGLGDERVAYPRLLGDRKAAVDAYIQQAYPGLLP
jgi:hypothetical protein